MIRLPILPRANWKQLAGEFGFKFHTMYGEPYWNESAYYQFTMAQIEQHLEVATETLHQMCLEVVERACRDESLMSQFKIPRHYWDLIADSWFNRDPSLYSRMDFAYDGVNPPKLYENNADTPTSVFETGFWQWLWLEDNVKSGRLSRASDQFTSLQEKLVARFFEIKKGFVDPEQTLHFAACEDSLEDRGTVQYLQDCAEEAGLKVCYVPIEQIGRAEQVVFTDLEDRPIRAMFKLYPWEFMFEETFGEILPEAQMQWLEPPWKAILSNKALLPVLWELFAGHPNLLPAYFEKDLAKANFTDYVRKPLFSREGANIEIVRSGKVSSVSEGPYGDEGYIVQAYHPLPKFGEHYTLVGSWLVGDVPAGISIREDRKLITQDMSQYLPHIILG